jgi:hypothetical protein
LNLDTHSDLSIDLNTVAPTADKTTLRFNNDQKSISFTKDAQSWQLGVVSNEINLFLFSGIGRQNDRHLNILVLKTSPTLLFFIYRSIANLMSSLLLTATFLPLSIITIGNIEFTA